MQERNPSTRIPSDEDLLDRRLFTSNPLEEPGLVLKLPRGVRMNGILAAYDHRAFRLPCAECGAARHYKGYVVELSDGRRTLLGNQCGAKLFGEAWTVHHRQFRRLVDRQALLRRADDLLARLPDLVALAARWRESLGAAARAIGEFSSGFPKVSQALRTVAAKEDGWLEADVAAPNVSGGSSPPRIERRRLGRLAGREAFSVAILHRRLDDARAALAGAQASLSRRNLDDRSLEQAVRGCGDAIETLARSAAANNAVLSFLAPRNLRLIGSWAALQPTLADEVPDGRLRRGTVERREEVVVDERRTVAVRRQKKLPKMDKAAKLLREARLRGDVENLLKQHPKLFTVRVETKRRRVIREIPRIVLPPEPVDVEPLDPGLLERLAGLPRPILDEDREDWENAPLKAAGPAPGR